MDSHDEETNDLSLEFDEHSGEGVEHNVNCFEIHADSILLERKRIETKEDEIASEQGEKLVATYADKLAIDIDPL